VLYGSGERNQISSHAEKPRGLAPGLRVFASFKRRRSEAVVDAEADDIGVELDVGVDDAGRGRTRCLAEIGVEIFQLGRPVAHEGVFDADAERVAHLGLGEGAERVGALDVAHRQTAGEIRQPVVPAGITEAHARCAQPGILGLAAQRAVGRGASLDAGIIDVAFQAPDPGAGLHVVAKRQAGEHARDVEVAGRTGGRRPVGFAEAIADVKTGVEAAPVGIDRRRIGRRFVAGLRQIGRLRGDWRDQECGNGEAGSDQFSRHFYRPL
jgi:hypothetical protein